KANHITDRITQRLTLLFGRKFEWPLQWAGTETLKIAHRHRHFNLNRFLPGLKRLAFDLKLRDILEIRRFTSLHRGRHNFANRSLHQPQKPNSYLDCSKTRALCQTLSLHAASVRARLSFAVGWRIKYSKIEPLPVFHR